MARFRDCIISARDQGVLSPTEADDLIRRHEAHLRAHAGEPDAAEAAKQALAKEFDAAGARQRRLVELTSAKQDEIAADLQRYRGPAGVPDVYEAAMRKLENFGRTEYSAVKGRSVAIVSLIHGQMADMLHAFERNFYTGLRHNKPLVRDTVREIFGEASGRPEAKAFAESISTSFEKLRQRFNAAGGDIGKIEGGYLPQFHEPLALYKAGFESWRDFILPGLDLARMRDPLTGGALTPDRLGESLKAVFDTVRTDGRAGRTSTLARQGDGAVAHSRADHRFLYFKSADDWLAYDQKFGHGDPLLAVFQHINGMARDISAMEILGPNPAAMVEWLKQVVLSEHAKATGNEQSLFNLNNWSRRGKHEAGQLAAQRIEDLYQQVRGRQVVSEQTADFWSDVRNLLTSAQLGSAVVTAATTDPAIEAATRRALNMSTAQLFGSNAKVYLDTVSRYFEQLPIVNVMSKMIDHMTGAPREQALRAGMIADDFLHIMGDQARYVGTLSGSVWSRFAADRTMMLTGLTPITEARRSVFQLELMGFLGDLSQKSFIELPDRLRGKLQGYGIGAAAWDKLRAVPQYRADPAAAGLLRPIDVAAADLALAERYTEMLLGETERAVPTSTLRSKGALVDGTKRGTFSGELMQSFLQYRSFGLSLLTLQMEALAHEGGIMSARGASYVGLLFGMTTLGGALSLQLKNIANGRDPQKMGEGIKPDPKFWLAAMATGGGFGIAGDFLFADYSRYGQSIGQTVSGPVGGLVGDIAQFTLGNAFELLQGKPTHAGKEATDLAGRYLPVVSSAWQTRLALKRMILDPLQYQIDPRAHRRWREQERRAIRERGQGFFWPPGEPAPTRSPDWSHAWP